MDSNNEYTHIASWPPLERVKNGIIETHYGFTAEEAAEAFKRFGQTGFSVGDIESKSGEFINKIFDECDEIIIHRGKCQCDLHKPTEMKKDIRSQPFSMQETHFLDTAGYLSHGSPHLPFEKSAVKMAESVHRNIFEKLADPYPERKSFARKLWELLTKLRMK